MMDKANSGVFKNCNNHIREKLVELLKEADRYEFEEKRNQCDYSVQKRWLLIADHLLTNGVTINEWIPVSEPPEKDGYYIVTACDEGCPYGEGIWYDTVVVLAEYYDDGRWVWYEGSTEYDLCDIVTHWMPLPQPPKGE